MHAAAIMAERNMNEALNHAVRKEGDMKMKNCLEKLE